jgi:hypothetical protein
LRKFFVSMFIGCALIVPTVSVAQVVVQVAPQRYYDRDHRDWHNWDVHEDRAYRAWGAEVNHPYVEWNRLPPRDQRNYWRWRHRHTDVVLNIR